MRLSYRDKARVTKLGLERCAIAGALAIALGACGDGPPPAAPAAGSAPAAAAAPARGVGVVQALDPSAGTVTISHEAIASLGWPAMTMSFKVAKPDLLQQVSVGEKVEFTLDGKDMAASITSLQGTR